MRTGLIGWAAVVGVGLVGAGDRQLLRRPLDGQRRRAREAVDRPSPATNGGGTSTTIPRDASKTLRTANELHLPVGVPVRINLNSNDVIHSFWVPSLAGKQDLIPGRDNDITIVPQQDRHLPRPVRRILRHAARAHGARRRTSTAIADFIKWWDHQLQPAPAPADAADARPATIM